MTSCGGMSSVTVRRSIRAIRSSTGITKITPGPRYGVRRPSRNTTPRSYSLSTLSPLIMKIAPMKTIMPTPLAIVILLGPQPPRARGACRYLMLSSERCEILRASRQLLHLQFQSLDRLHAGASAGAERVVAGGAPNLAMHENLAGRAGCDRLAHFADLADDTLRTGGRAIAALARHDVSDAEDDQRQCRGGAVYNVAIDHQVGLGRVDQKQRSDQERGNAAQTEDSVTGDEGLRDQQSDAEKNQQQAGEINRQHLERREREQQANRAGDAR